MKPSGFFCEDNGNRSWMRLAGQQILSVALFIAVFSVVTKQLDVNIITMVLTMIGAALTWKMIQKRSEEKECIPTEPKAQ